MAGLEAPGGSKDKPLLFTAWLDFPNMTFQAVQYQAATPDGADKRPSPRRLFALAVNSLPAVEIPLIGNVTQPFDEMLLLYVSAEDGDTAESGVTFAELKAINDELQA